MKKLFVILLLAVAVSIQGAPRRTYKNISSPDNRISYAFRLVGKMNPRVGFFRPIRDHHYYDYVEGNRLSARGGGGKPGKVEVYDQKEEQNDIVIVGYDLRNLADGELISLREGQTLYQIGLFTTPQGENLAVFSLNKNDKTDRYIPPRPRPPAAGETTSLRCPHCGQTIKLTPSK